MKRTHSYRTSARALSMYIYLHTSTNIYIYLGLYQYVHLYINTYIHTHPTRTHFLGVNTSVYFRAKARTPISLSPAVPHVVAISVAGRVSV